MKTSRRLFLIVFVLVACVGCDQATKIMARQALAGPGTISYLNDFVRLYYVENPGAILSLGATIPENTRYWIFIVLMGIFLTALLVFLLTSERISQGESIALSLLLSGGVGNLIDRICNEGRVIDFMNIGIGSLRTGVFNVADIVIAVGCVWFLVLAMGRQEKVV